MTDEDAYAALRRSAIRIIETWEQAFHREGESFQLRSERRRGRKALNLDLRVSTLLLGFASDVVTLAGTIIELLDKERAREAMPLVRVSYESALTSQWVSAVGRDAAIAIIGDYVKKQSAVSTDMKKVPREIYQKAAEDLPHAGIETPDTSSAFQAKNFQSMTADLQGGEEMYVHYRLMCRYTHPGMAAIDQYFSKPEGDQGGPVFSYQPRQPDRDLWMLYTVMSLCQAVHPLAILLPEGTLKDTVEETSKSHQIPIRIGKTDRCRARLADAKKAKYGHNK